MALTLTQWAARHRRSLLFLLALGVIAGLISGFSLPVALFPDVSFPRIVVSLDAGDLPAETTVAQVTRPIEQAVKSVPGLRDVRSTTSRGAADISLTFDWGLDMYVTTLQVESAVARAVPSLPAGTRFEVRRMNPTVFPVAAYSLTSDTVDQTTLRDIAQYELLPLLSSVNGVASANVLGGEVREYRVEINPAQAASYGLSIDDIVKALSADNVLRVTGRIEDRHKLLLAVTDTRLHSLADIGAVVVHGSTTGAVHLSDVAKVYESAEPNYTIVTADQRRAVLVQVFQQPSGNTVQIVADVASALKNFEHRLPRGVIIHNWYDQSQLITASAFSVFEAILIGVFLAGGVLYLFLRNRRLTFIVMIIVPAVLAATVLALSQFRMSFNIMTLGGMAAAIGLIVDDAIVMIEQIVRRLQERSEDAHTQIRAAAAEFLAPLAGSSAATIIIFVPLAFLGGVTGAFFQALSLTMASALIVSFVIAWLIVPLLADHLITREDAESDTAHGLMRGLIHRYRESYRQITQRPSLVWIAPLLLLGVGSFAYMQLGSGFMPSMDEGGFTIDYIAPPGTSLTDTNNLLAQVETILRETPEVDTYSRRTGAQLGGGLTEPNTGDFFVRLKPLPRRPIDDITTEIVQKVQDRVPGLQIETSQLMEDMIGDLTSVPQPIEVKIYGDDPAAIRTLATRTAALIAKVDGVTEIKSGVVLAGDGLDIQVDRIRAAVEGLDSQTVAGQVQNYLAGTVATTVQQADHTIGIRIWTPPASRASIDNVRHLLLTAPDGHKVPLSRIAVLKLLTGEPELTRDNLKAMTAVTARIEGRDLGSTAQAVQVLLDRSGLFMGANYFEMGGLYAEQQAAFKGLLEVIVAAFMLVFVLLLFLYERFDFAVSIIAMPLFAMPAAFIGLWVTGTELNISAMMGMTMVVGIVTEVAVFYTSEYERLIAEGMEIERALFEAGTNRFRPIAMTTLAAILALLPLALGLGQGAAMQQPLAIAIVSGLIVQMPLVLLILPQLVQRLGTVGGSPNTASQTGNPRGGDGYIG